MKVLRMMMSSGRTENPNKETKGGEFVKEKNDELYMKREYFIQLKDGMELFVEHYDSNKEDTVLFVHGGPGESCVSFSYFAALASQYVNVVMLDQRGVMRSKEERRPELLTVQQLVDDFEEVRKQLHIDKWYILGHSFGGYVAMRYVLCYPQSIKGVIYENPCFNIEHSLSTIIEKYIEYYDKIGEEAKKQKVQKLLDLNDIVEKFDGIISLPDIDRKRVFKSEAITLKCREFFDQSLITPDAIRKCLHHYNVIKYDETLCIEYLHKLKDINCSSLLIQGEMDPMLPLSDKEEWLNNPRSSAVIVDETGHYVHSDAPETMVDILNEYICKNSSEEV